MNILFHMRVFNSRGSGTNRFSGDAGLNTGLAHERAPFVCAEFQVGAVSGASESVKGRQLTGGAF